MALQCTVTTNPNPLAKPLLDGNTPASSLRVSWHSVPQRWMPGGLGSEGCSLISSAPCPWAAAV